jgi:electron transfer flavoprotein beta subunit
MKELRLIVTIKQVPDTAEVKIDPQTNSLIREGVPSIINPEDRNAVEEALRLKEKHGGTVTVVSMGPPQAGDALEEVLAMGADQGVLLTDRAFAGSDTLITAFILSRAIMKLGDCDLIVSGRQAIDGDTAQVGPQLAGFLDLPQVTYAEEISLEGEDVVVKRHLEDCMEWVRLKPPALITVTSEINRPRYPSLYNVLSSCDGSRMKVWGAKELKVLPEMIGLNASPTGVKRIFEPDRGKKGEFLQGSEKEMAKELIQRLKATNII